MFRMYMSAFGCVNKKLDRRQRPETEKCLVEIPSLPLTHPFDVPILSTAKAFNK